MRSPLGLDRGQTPPSTACDCSTRPRLPTSSVLGSEGMVRSHVEPTRRFQLARVGPPLSGHLGRMAYSAHPVGAPIRVGADTAL